MKFESQLFQSEVCKILYENTNFIITDIVVNRLPILDDMSRSVLLKELFFTTVANSVVEWFTDFVSGLCGFLCLSNVLNLRN